MEGMEKALDLQYEVSQMRGVHQPEAQQHVPLKAKRNSMQQLNSMWDQSLNRPDGCTQSPCQ